MNIKSDKNFGLNPTRNGMERFTFARLLYVWLIDLVKDKFNKFRLLIKR